jgi:acid phosphatase (class A)
MNFSKIIVIFVSFFLISSAKAQTYFDINSISPNLIDPAIKIGSELWNKEVTAIVELQKNLDLEIIDQALSEKKLRPETLVQFVEPSFTRQSHPKLYHLLERTRSTSKGVTDNIKEYWGQTRPYLADPRIKMLISPSKGPSYPSGHATGSYIYAHVLGLLMPEKRQILQNYATIIAQNRIAIGMHYAQDARSGKELALLIVGGLMRDQEFRNDFAKAKDEITGY